MNFLYRLFYILSATSWMLVFNSLKYEWTIFGTSWLITFFFLIFLTIGSAGISLLLTHGLSKEDNVSGKDIAGIEAKNISFLPSYIAYCLIGFNMDILWKLMFVWLFVSLLLELSRIGNFFNISYLLFGYHHYEITTARKEKIYMLSKRKIKGSQKPNFNTIKRINDYSFIEGRKNSVHDDSRPGQGKIPTMQLQESSDHNR